MDKEEMRVEREEVNKEAIVKLYDQYRDVLEPKYGSVENYISELSEIFNPYIDDVAEVWWRYMYAGRARAELVIDVYVTHRGEDIEVVVMLVGDRSDVIVKPVPIDKVGEWKQYISYEEIIDSVRRCVG